MVDTVHIRGKRVGAKNPCYIVATLYDLPSDPEEQFQLIEDISRAGVDAISYPLLNNLYDHSRDKAAYHWKKLSDAHHLAFIPIVYDQTEIGYAKEVDVAALEIPALWIRERPTLVDCATRQGLPLLIDTAGVNIKELKEVMRIVDEAANHAVVLLHSKSAPTPQLNMRAMDFIRRSFNRPSGWACHYIDYTTCVIAAHLGAALVQQLMIGPQESISNLQHLVRLCKGRWEPETEITEDILGDGRLISSEKGTTK